VSQHNTLKLTSAHTAHYCHTIAATLTAPPVDDETRQRRRSFQEESLSGVDDVLSRGDWFGEEALMDTATPAAADVVAITDVELLVLSGNDLRWVIGDRPGLGIGVGPRSYGSGNSVIESFNSWKNASSPEAAAAAAQGDGVCEVAAGRSCARRPRVDRLIARNR
jgi:Cyclic nucleotide-binding domain